MSGCEVKVNNGFQEVWFIAQNGICWVPRGELETKLDTALEVLQAKGFIVTRKQVEKVLKDGTRT